MEEAFWNHGKVVAATSEVSGSKAAPTGKDLRELPRTSHLNRKRFDRIDILSQRCAALPTPDRHGASSLGTIFCKRLLRMEAHT